MKWKKATSRGKAVAIMVLVLLIVIVMCFALIFEISASNEEGR